MSFGGKWTGGRELDILEGKIWGEGGAGVKDNNCLILVCVVKVKTSMSGRPNSNCLSYQFNVIPSCIKLCILILTNQRGC